MRSFTSGISLVGVSFLVVAAWSPPAVADPSIESSDGETQRAEPPATGTKVRTVDRQHGSASFYARHFEGRKTASGERYDPRAFTAAHRTLPLGTRVRVVNTQNDRSVVVTVNDRGPFSKYRMIDVSSAAADELGMKRAGVARVETHVVFRDASSGEHDTSIR